MIEVSLLGLPLMNSNNPSLLQFVPVEALTFFVSQQGWALPA